MPMIMVSRRQRRPDAPDAESARRPKRVSERTGTLRLTLTESRQKVHDTLSSLMDDMRLGRKLQLGSVRNAVRGLLTAVLHDPEAASYLVQLSNAHNDLAQRCVHAAIMALVFGKGIGIPKERLTELGMAALLCDVGMLCVPRDLYVKSGPLTSAEREKIRQHVEQGVELLRAGAGCLSSSVMSAVEMHHERFDGTGYPNGIAGKAIPLHARIVQIVSVYMALTSRRPYAEPISPKAALARLYQEAGRAFDQVLVQKFISCIGIYPPGSVVELDSGEVGIVVSSLKLNPLVRLHYGPGRIALPTPQSLDLSRNGEPRRVVRVLEPNEYRLSVAEGEEQRETLELR